MLEILFQTLLIHHLEESATHLARANKEKGPAIGLRYAWAHATLDEQTL